MDISVKKIIHMLSMFGICLINIMGNYRNLYLKTDVLLLANLFERFVNTCLNYYGLDPCHYFSSPRLS